MGLRCVKNMQSDDTIGAAIGAGSWNREHPLSDQVNPCLAPTNLLIGNVIGKVRGIGARHLPAQHFF